MAKQQIRLTESELQNLIAEAVKQELNEGAFDFLRGMGRKIKGDANTLATNAMTNAKNMGNNAMTAAKNMGANIGKNIVQGYNKVAKPIQNYAKDVYQAGQDASNQADARRTIKSNQADAQKAIKSLENLVAKGVLGRNIANMAIGSLRKYGNQ